MFSFQLFFGYAVDQAYQEALNQVDSNLVLHFIQPGGDYLQEINHEGTRYLGKFVGKEVPLAQLELFEANIYSLLEKLVPNYPYQKFSLILLPVEDPNAV